MSDTRKIRLYRATTEVDVLFVLPDGVCANLAASDYLAQEIDTNGLLNSKFKVDEITDIQQVPKRWTDCLVWGFEKAGLKDDLTPEIFFKHIFKRSEDEVVLLEIERHQMAIDELKKRLASDQP
jgi:hypothetical protein